MKGWSGLQDRFKDLQLGEPQAMLLARTLEFLLQAPIYGPLQFAKLYRLFKHKFCMYIFMYIYEFQKLCQIMQFSVTFKFVGSSEII